jgi:hypothetical protein
VKDHLVAGSRLHQRVSERRYPADVIAIEINFVGADDADDSFRSSGIGVANSRPKENVRRRTALPRGSRVHDLGSINPFGEKANAPIDLAQPSLSVLVVGVLTAIAVARGPGDNLRDRWAFSRQQEAQLVSQTL